MKHMTIITGFTLAICCSSAVVAASKAGLWEATTDMNIGGAMPQIPPAQLEMMKQRIKIPGMGPTVNQYCLTPEQAARDTPPADIEKRGCKMTNMTKSASGMKADLVCDGEFKGSGHIEATNSGDAAYTMKMNMKGTSEKSPVPIDMSMSTSAKWLSADCGSVKPIGNGK